MESTEDAAQILGQNAICIAFSKLTGSPLLTANRLKTRSPNLTWTELKKMNYPHNTLSFHLILMQPRISSVWNKVKIRSFMVTYTM